MDRFADQSGGGVGCCCFDAIKRAVRKSGRLVNIKKRIHLLGFYILTHFVGERMIWFRRMDGSFFDTEEKVVVLLMTFFFGMICSLAAGKGKLTIVLHELMT